MRSRLYRTFLWSLVVSLGAVAVIGTAILLLPDLLPWVQTGRLLASAAIFAMFSLLGLTLAAALERDRARPVMVIGLIAAAAALGLWLFLIWSPTPQYPEWLPVKIATELTFVTGWAAFVGAILLRTSGHPRVRTMQRIALALVTLVAGYFIIIIWFEFDEWWFLRGIGSTATLLGWMIWSSLMLRFIPSKPVARRISQATVIIATALALHLMLLTWWDYDRFREDFLLRLLGVLIILTATGSLITACLVLMERFRKRTVMDTMSGRIEVALTCPRCATPLRLRAGLNRCSNCNLRIGLDMEEPRCSCGYLLHKLTGITCPECGRTVPEADRWHGAINHPAATTPANANDQPGD